MGATPLHIVSDETTPDQGVSGTDVATTNDDFRSLFEVTYRPLVAYARRRVVEQSEADDVVAEVFSTAWRRRDDLRPDTDPLPWLYGIAANVVRNHRRSAARRLRLVDEIGQQPQLHHPAPDPSDRPGAELRAALAELSFDDQEVLRLSAWEGLAHADIALALDVSENAVAIRLHRARGRLRTQLAEHRSSTTTQTRNPDANKDRK